MYTSRYGAVLLVLGLAACGGGGGGSDKTPPPPPVDSYLVTATAASGGSIVPASATVNSGARTTFTITANEGFSIASVTGCGGVLNGNAYTIAAVSADCTVSATFATAVVDNGAPTAKILFPWKASRIDEKNVVVHGVASDSSGIASVRVNGVDATLQPVSASTKRWLSKAEGESVEWTATVSLPFQKDIPLTVEVSDQQGNVASEADSATISTVVIPTFFVIDSTNRRIVGRDSRGDLVSEHLDSGEARRLAVGMPNVGTPQVYLPDSDAVVYGIVMEGQFQLTSVDTESGELEVLIDHTLGYDTNDWLFANVKDMSYLPSQNAIYALLIYFSKHDYNLNKSVVLRYDVSTKAVTTVVDRETTNGDLVQSDAMAAVDDGLLVLNGFFGSGDDALTKVAIDGSELSQISAATNMLAARIDVDQQAELAYLTGYNGVASVELDTGDFEVISDETQVDSLTFSQIASTGLDLPNQRLLVGDSDRDLVVAVDLVTGERTEAYANGVGTGHRFVMPRDFVIDHDNNVAYVVDDGGNAPEVLIKVDLGSGNRTKISNIDQPFNVYVTDVLLDAQNQKLYVLFLDSIWRVDIATEATETIASNDIGTGPVFAGLSGVAFDAAGEHLLVTDSAAGAVFSVSIATGNRTVVSQAGVTGTGIALDGAVDVELDADNNVLYVLAQRAGAVYSVDLANGNRTLLFDQCLSTSNEDHLPTDDGSVQNLYFDSVARELLVTGSSVLRYNLSTQECDPIENASFSYSGSVLDIDMTREGQILGSMQNKLVQVDTKTGAFVTISK